MMIKANKNLPIFSQTETDTPKHPLGSRAKVLLTGVFGPYAQDDEYGSRKLNPMELYHNQVTRTQGPFSLRMFHRSWGLMMIQNNIKAPCTLLDFPVLDRFIEEITTRQYDIIGISSIIPNQGKVRKMCELIRQYQPDATIIIGGHIANIPDLDQRIDADHIVKGEGVAWFRRFLGEDDQQPVRHPITVSGIGTRNAGVSCPEKPGDVAATVIPSVGCPLGCNFCSTSAMFGGKGKFISFYETGDELFHVMCQMEKELQVQSFFMMDENFLFYKKRALRLLELMEEHGKAWALYVFSSANVLKTYTIEQLVGLGISWVWMGLEGEDSQYKKLHGIDVPKMVKELQSHGIRVLGSSIIGLEEHTPENIDAAIDYSVAYNTDFHQFMLYTPIPGTPLHAELSAKGVMKDESTFDPGDIHGQLIFNYHHSNITDGQEGEYMLRAFDRDFEVNGPSVLRIARTTLTGWQRHKNHPDKRVRARFAFEANELKTTYSALAGAAVHYYRDNPTMQAKMKALRDDLIREFGLLARLASLFGRFWVSRKIQQEEKRLAEGWTYEPPTFYERNAHCTDNPKAAPCRAATPLTAQQPVTPSRIAGKHQLSPTKKDDAVTVG
ncbi:MAG: cobalamin-dependent protein [Pirellulales bacterium]|nr:cobalamin-dependent protein [Pirellulales bacterium]